MSSKVSATFSIDDLPNAALLYKRKSGVIVSYNKAAKKILGCPHDHISNRKIKDLFPRLKLKASRQVIEVNLPDSDRLLLVQSKALSKTDLVLLILDDAIPTRRVDASLSRMSVLADNIRDAVIFSLTITHDKNLVVEYISAGVETLFGITPEQVLTDYEHLWSNIIEEDQFNIMREIASATKVLRPLNVDFRMPGHSTDYRWFNARAFVRHDKSGKLVWDGVIQEVTVTKSLEQRLRDSEATLHNIFQSMISGVVVVNQKGEITYANPSAVNILALERERIHNLYFSSREWRQVDDFGQPYPTEKLPLAIALTEGLEVKNCEHGIMVDHNEVKWLSVNAAPLFNSDNEVVGAVASFLDATKSRDARKSLEELANQLNAVLNASTDSTFFLDHACKVRVVNKGAAKAVAKIFGKQIKPGDSMYDFALPEIIPDFKQNFLNALRGEIISHQRRLQYRDVLDVWTLVRYLPVKDQDGVIIGVSFNLTDLTARKQAEEDSQQKEMQLRIAATLAQIGDWEFDLATNTFSWSDEVCRIHDLPPGTKPALDTVMKFYPPEFHDQIYQVVNHCIDTGEPYDLQLEIITAKGVRKFVRTIGMTEREDGKAIKLFGLFQDITRQREVQNELEKLALIAKHTDNAVVITDVNRRIEWVNDAFIHLTEFSLDEVIGKSPGEVLQGLGTDERIVEKIRHDLDRGQSSNFEILNYSKSGRPYWIEVYIQPVFNKKRELTNFIAIELEITERKRAELMLKQAHDEIQLKNEQISTLAENIPGGAIYQLLIANDGSRKFLYFSSGLENLLGIKSADILKDHTNLYRNHHEDDVPALIAAEQNAVRHLQLFSMEFRIYDGAGKVRWFFAKSKPKETDEGVLFNGFVLDITDRKLAEQKIVESEIRFRLLADSLPVFIWMGGLDGQGKLYFSYFNRQWRTVMSSADSSTEMLLERIDEEDREAYINLLRKSFSSKSSYRTEVRIRAEDGSLKYLFDTGVPRFLPSGEFVGFVGTAIDITDRKLAEQQLRESENRYRTIVEDQVEMICRYQKDGTLTFVNSAYARAFRRSPSELIGQNIFEFIPPSDRERLRKYVSEVFMGVVEPKQNEQLVTSFTGVPEWQEWFDVPVTDGQGKIIEIQAIGHNITYRKKLELERVEREKKLEAIIEEKDMLLKEIHHRIKNNLQLISSIIYIKMVTLADGEVKTFLESTRQKIRSIALIHERLLQSRSLNSVEIADYLGKLVLDIQMSLHRQDVNIEVSTELENAALGLDTAIYCGLVVNELVTNSVKHAFTGRDCGRIWVSFARRRMTDIC